MREPLSNVGYVCDAHAPKPDQKLAGMPDGYFVGKHVKVAIPVILNGRDGTEHIWVKVISDSEGVIDGLVDSDPVGMTMYRHKDKIRFKREEIEQLYMEN